jgi:hypothetical protein
MTASVEPRQIRLFRSAVGEFPAAWRRFDHSPESIEAETVNPPGTMVLLVAASADSRNILITLLRSSDRAFMAETQFPLSSWQTAKEFLEGIALEAFVVGVDQRDGQWIGSMILRAADLPRRRDFSYVRSWLGTHDTN